MSINIKYYVFLPRQKYILQSFLSFFHGRNTFYNHFCLSSTAEIHSTIIFVFLPWQKYILQSFLYFFHGRNTQYNLFCLSSIAERHNTILFVFLPWQKYILLSFLYFFHGRKTKNAAVDLFSRIINLVFNRVDPKNVEK